MMRRTVLCRLVLEAVCMPQCPRTLAGLGKGVPGPSHMYHIYQATVALMASFNGICNRQQPPSTALVASSNCLFNGC